MKIIRVVALSLFVLAIGIVASPSRSGAQGVADVPTGCGSVQHAPVSPEGVSPASLVLDLDVLSAATRSPFVDLLASLFSRPQRSSDSSPAAIAARRIAFDRVRAGMPVAVR
jgi:hypothetical protein